MENRIEEVIKALAEKRFISPHPENNLTRAREWVRQHQREVDIICQLIPQPLDGIRHPQCNHKDMRCPSMEKQEGVDYGRCLLRNPWDCSLGFSPQPLTDEKLREKIDACVKKCPGCGGSGYITKGYLSAACWRCKAKSYLIDYDILYALLQPKIEHLLDQLKLADKNYLELKNAFDERIEEAVIQARKEQMVIDWAQAGKDIELAKREERERIIKWGVEPCPHWEMYPDVKVIKRDCALCWQALKGGE